MCFEIVKQSGMSKKGVKWFKIIGEKLFFEIIVVPHFWCKKHWLLVIDDSIDLAWIENLELKNVIVKDRYGINMSYARYDTTGERKDFERACKQEEIGVKSEYAMPDTPQQNGHLLLCY